MLQLHLFVCPLVKGALAVLKVETLHCYFVMCCVLFLGEHLCC